MTRGHAYGRTLLVIFLICLLSYFNSLKVPFQFDGVGFIQENPYIKDFSTFFTKFRIVNLMNRSILVFTFTLNHYLEQDNTLGYHLFNLFLHFAVCLFIYLIARKTLLILKRKGVVSLVKWNNFPLIAALLFATHPVHTQSVTYLMSRSVLLCTFFYLASFYCLVAAGELTILKPASRRNRVHAAGLAGLALFLTLLGFGSKLIIVSLPVMALVYFFMFLKPADESLFVFILNKKRLLSLIALPFVVFVIYKSFFTSKGLLRIADLGTLHFSRVDYFLSQIKWAGGYYLKTLFFPMNLNVDPDVEPVKTFANSDLIFSALVWIGLILLVKKQPKLAQFGFLWFVITLAPESSFIPLLDLVAEHRLYLPGIGVALGISYGLAHRRVLFPCLFLIILFAANTVHRNTDWASETSLWKDTIAKSPGKARPFINYARALHFEGKLESAIENYKKAIALEPNYFQHHHNLGEAYAEAGKCRDALNSFQNALKLAPKLAESMVGLGKCYYQLKEYKNAVFYLREAIENQPSMDFPFRMLGMIHYFNLNEKEKGLFYFRQALRLNPNHPNNAAMRNLIESQGS